MGSECRIVAAGVGSDALVAAESSVARLESRWSRFLDSSEISWLNRHAGAPAYVSRTTAELLRRAMYAAHETDGLFNPFLLTELQGLGYNTSLCEPAATCGSGELRSLGDATRVVELDAGASIDPGGIGKGYAADLVASMLRQQGATAVWVALGGDLRICGEQYERSPLTIEVQDPWMVESVIATIAVSGGGVATSSTLRRRWIDSSGVERHHLLDPRTRCPSESDIAAATVVAGETWWAEALAKAMVIGGMRAARSLCRGHGVTALVSLAPDVHELLEPSATGVCA